MAVKPAKPPAGAKNDGGKGGGDKKRLILIALLFAGLLLGGGGTAGVLYFFGFLSGEDKSGRKIAVVSLGQPVIVDFPEMMVDLKVGTCKSPYLRFRMAVEVTGGGGATVVNDTQAQINDAIQQHLRGRERQELVGVEGADRMRNDAREIINRLIAPERINGVIFKKFVLQ